MNSLRSFEVEERPDRRDHFPSFVSSVIQCLRFADPSRDAMNFVLPPRHSSPNLTRRSLRHGNRRSRGGHRDNASNYEPTHLLVPVLKA